MGANLEPVGANIANYVSEQLGIPTAFMDDPHWKKREQLFDAGVIHISWMCGLHYVFKAQQNAPIELLAAPVMTAPHYENQPVYFSDVIVRHEGEFAIFDDLAGATWAYNEPRSHSGCYLARYHLATRGRDANFFGKIIESGSHRSSMEQVLEGQIHAAAIDSTILEWEFYHNPDLRQRLRIIETLGPSPSPPWVISKSIPADLRQALQKLLTCLHQTEQGREILEAGFISRFSKMEDSSYDPIRQMAKKAEQIAW